jgi:hypothetical protein
MTVGNVRKLIVVFALIVWGVAIWLIRCATSP